MVRTNGLDSRDPDYNDFGFSDFFSDYDPEDHQLHDWICENPEKTLEIIIDAEKEKYSALAEIKSKWIENNEDEIEKEWDANHEPDPDYEHDKDR